PMLDALGIQLDAIGVLARQLGIIGAQLFEEFPVARSAGIGHNDMIVGAVLGAPTAHADFLHSFFSLFKFTRLLVKFMRLQPFVSNLCPPLSSDPGTSSG